MSVKSKRKKCQTLNFLDFVDFFKIFFTRRDNFYYIIQLKLRHDYIRENKLNEIKFKVILKLNKIIEQQFNKFYT